MITSWLTLEQHMTEGSEPWPFPFLFFVSFQQYFSFCQFLLTAMKYILVPPKCESNRSYFMKKKNPRVILDLFVQWKMPGCFIIFKSTNLLKRGDKKRLFLCVFWNCDGRPVEREKKRVKKEKNRVRKREKEEYEKKDRRFYGRHERQWETKTKQ